MFKQMIANAIVDKLEIPDNATIKDVSAFAEEVMIGMDAAKEQHLDKYIQIDSTIED